MGYTSFLCHVRSIEAAYVFFLYDSRQDLPAQELEKLCRKKNLKNFNSIQLLTVKFHELCRIFVITQTSLRRLGV